MNNTLLICEKLRYNGKIIFKRINGKIFTTQEQSNKVNTSPKNSTHIHIQAYIYILLNSKKANNSIRTRKKDIKRHFTENYIHVENK